MQGFMMMDLLRAVYWFDEALQEALRRHGWEHVTRSQSLILANVAFGVRRGAQLARNLGVTRQAVSQMLADMEKRDLIVVTKDPTDARAQVVNFSRQSQKLRDDAMMILTTIETELAKRLGKRRYEALAESLRRDWGAPVFQEERTAAQ